MLILPGLRRNRHDSYINIHSSKVKISKRIGLWWFTLWVLEVRCNQDSIASFSGYIIQYPLMVRERIHLD